MFYVMFVIRRCVLHGIERVDDKMLVHWLRPLLHVSLSALILLVS